MNKKTRDGIKAYTPLSLKFYYWWVHQVSNRYAWQCDTERHLIPHFRNNMKITTSMWGRYRLLPDVYAGYLQHIAA
ncbi:hypothetical protein [Enterobacter mori]